MKYIYWFVVGIVSLLLKVVGNPVFPFVWLAFSVRRWARESVYSYTLENGKTIKRLLERRPEEVQGGWKLHGYEHKGGFVERRNISWIRYAVAMCIWVFLDDDSDVDTYSKGHNNTYVTGERSAPKWVVDRMRKANENAIQGSQFELGDVRGYDPRLDVVSTFYWTGRNSAYNFNYKFLQISDESKVWYKRIGKLEFGWRPDWNKVDGKSYYTHVFGYNF